MIGVEISKLILYDIRSITVLNQNLMTKLDFVLKCITLDRRDG